jgi:hypothetical protein
MNFPKKPEKDSYEIAFERAADTLQEVSLPTIREKCAVEISDGTIGLQYFNSVYAINVPDVTFQPDDLSLAEKILLLHYLTTLGNKKTDGKYIPFKQLPGASFYNPTYRKRGPNIILKVFGDQPDKIRNALEKPCVTEETVGDVSVKISIFPRIDAIVTMHRGDEEFEPECQILYNDEIQNLLPLEDVAVLAGRIAKYLITWAG